MRVYRHSDEITAEHQGGAIAIGNFDGVHLGHQTVINAAGNAARAGGVPWGVLTFEPHPRMVFDAGAEPFRLTPFHAKLRQIEALGVDFLVVLHFDKKLASMAAEEFVMQVLIGGFGARHIVSGHDFVFGHNRKGTADYLAAKGAEHGFQCESIAEVLGAGGEGISSTRIRQYLFDANPADAARLLGHPYEIEGRVAHGDERGRQIGFRTANIELEANVRPALGVYAVRAGIDEGPETVWHDGVANLGYRPTFDGETPVLEAHLFDFDQDIYGKHLRVGLIDFLRPERKFDGVEALKAQIDKDCKEASLRLKPGNWNTA
ncbi:MAG: bifunctional riboflavin kinase/FAD synthetase [Rhodospirillaceae bacterium]|mgnify:CR=1 FL=1|jgi:riboflavin kinase/FMN adenylyltransferase|nr:bifunctional riboflavin kinase/FAD synthetase [Rhodospirillaceae bacterium]MBT4721542.1 bifunctional riboflavin kinase/FAD synthetase [Rhodospirillaceae bacterium]MBT4748162.1 bifunctional riboflavin kinase/FAD synthetase [Rhodospirillaceae bacterium]MBT5178142.1 bifunctional riboflavin kinase/FAD synthetase [Rhodospirillaceae bacterium]MBT6861230.1 bifunctional riboflavin kinase/FAD synthetase [Rhodospirillaceae bacterium]